MGFNWESDTEELRDESCRCGQRYTLDVNPAAREGQYAVTARPILAASPESGNRHVEHHDLDADETACIRCGEEVPFAEVLTEGPLSEAEL